MMWRKLIACVLATCVAAACAPALSSVPVVASEADLARLAGEWEGDYVGSQSGRSGSIVFRLTAGSDSAQGDVVMIPADGMGSMPSESSAPASAHAEAHTPRVLTITFVRVADGKVSGTLDAYTDPACGCTVTTTFVGTQRGDVIEGTFHSSGGPGQLPQEGTWRVQRKARS